ncbi:MAG: site-specific DNA-methyltransferase [Rikenellaceae bacterium]|nr:site-specific DNA-methyltransferase [Rikenellaceae bacterium]MCL2692202.1 site-specific DNA-methyltransferase [Rikenellaceae bacterium]
MADLPDKSVHLVITSPPYWQLKDYGTEDQIGFNTDYEGYINNLNLVWKECYRVLHDGCRLCVNIGDQFARAVYYGRYKVIPIREEIIKFCENIGFDYMGAIIWQKVTTSNTSGGGVQMGSYPYPRNGILKLDYEFILIFKKLGDAPKPTLEQKERSKMTPEEWNTFFAGHWNFPGVKQSEHIAMFPEMLPHRLIKMFSFVGETVLDPFLGSGTTSLAAKNLGRNSVGYEINPEYILVIEGKLSAKQSDLLGMRYEFIKSVQAPVDYESLIKNQPYIFKDPHAFNKKIDVKKLQFGSKLDKNGAKKNDELFTVKEVISVNKVRLSNGLTIGLLGVKKHPEINGEAEEFLVNKIRGKRVFLKYDKVKYDKDDTLMCYLYLENKTFINAHIIKNKLALVDTEIDYKYKSKFLSLM